MAKKIKKYTFKATINGIEYLTKVSPKQHAALRKRLKKAREIESMAKSLKNGLSVLNEKEKIKAQKEIQKLNKQADKIKSPAIKMIRKRTHAASTTNKFGVKTTLTTTTKRKNAKPKNGITYYIVFRINGEVGSNTYQYEFAEGGVYTAIEDGMKGDNDFYAIVERRFSREVALSAEIHSVTTVERSKSNKK